MSLVQPIGFRLRHLDSDLGFGSLICNWFGLWCFCLIMSIVDLYWSSSVKLSIYDLDFSVSLYKPGSSYWSSLLREASLSLKKYKGSPRKWSTGAKSSLTKAETSNDDNRRFFPFLDRCHLIFYPSAWIVCCLQEYSKKEGESGYAPA